MALAMWRAMENEEISIHRMYLARKSIITSYSGLRVFDQELGIQKHLATMICKMIFENDIAKVTLEIADESVLRVEKDVSVTFAEMLGTIGKSLKDLQGVPQSTVILTPHLFLACPEVSGSYLVC